MDWTTLRFSAGWAAKRQERLKAAFGEAVYRDLEAVVLWGLGARAADLQGVRGLGRSSLYEHLTAVLTAPPTLPGDAAEESAQPAARPVPPAVAGRIVELLVGHRLDAAGIVAQLATQDGTQVNAAAVQGYLQQAGLADYASSVWRDQALPTPAPAAGVLTRYAAHLLHVPALQALGLERVLPLLDVTPPSAYYSHHLRCYTLLFALAAGKALGATQARILHYANSGDVTGDKSRVVGYAAGVIVQS